MVLGVAIHSAVDVEFVMLSMRMGPHITRLCLDFSGVYTRSFGEWSSGHSSKTERERNIDNLIITHSNQAAFTLS